MTAKESARQSNLFARRHNRDDSFARRRANIWLASARIANFCLDASSFPHQSLELLVNIDLQQHMHKNTKRLYNCNSKDNNLASNWAKQTEVKLVAYPISHFP